MTMTSDQIRSKFLEFFKNHGHAIIPSASLVPENDPTVLFNTAGMQPLVPYLLGEKHPMGTRLADSQKCVRTGDIEDVGDNRHLTFFEMLGNWSLGDYFKKEAIEWSMDFLTNKETGLGLDPQRLFVTVFKGENGIPRDEDAIGFWKEQFSKRGIAAEVAGEDEIISGEVRIIPLGVDDNFWIAGATGPCGGDTEIFYDTRPEAGKLEGKFETLVKSFRIIEIWNNVFMEFNKTAEGKYDKLPKPNVDTGMGLERTTAVLVGVSTVFETDCFLPILAKIQELSTNKNERPERVVADHMRTAVFMIADGVTPSNTDRGYILRRILRRAVRFADMLGITENKLMELVSVIVEKMGSAYPNLVSEQKNIEAEITKEEEKFRKTLKLGIKEFEKISAQNISGSDAFLLFSSYGFPLEMTVELAREKGITVDESGFKEEFKKHQDLSRIGAEQKFKGGLAGTGEIETRYHTATHLLNAALRQVLGEHVYQKGSNITAERMRFDFSHGAKMTDEEKKRVEIIVNEKIQAALPVVCEEMPVADAKAKGAIGVFDDKYGSIVKVYTVGNTEAGIFSMELCGGPHVKNTSELGHFKIAKEEAVSAGVRRIKAVLE
ncbi:MAG: alanine--tRNA ligase [Candidatus Paceibacterota bacterium]